MKKLIVNLAALNLIACGGAQFDEQESPEQLGVNTDELVAQANETGDIPGFFIVRLKDDADPSAVAMAHGLSANFTYRNTIRGFAGPLSSRFALRSSSVTGADRAAPRGLARRRTRRPNTARRAHDPRSLRRIRPPGVPDP